MGGNLYTHIPTYYKQTVSKSNSNPKKRMKDTNNMHNNVMGSDCIAYHILTGNKKSNNCQYNILK